MNEQEPLEHAKEQSIAKGNSKNKIEKKMLDGLMERYTQRFEGKYSSKVRNYELAFKSLFIVIALLLGINFILVKQVISISDKKEIHIEVAKEITSGSYVLGPDWASKTYINMFAKSIILDKTNFTFVDFKDKVNDMLNYTLADVYIQSLADLKRDVEFVETNKITQTFRVKEWSFVTDPNTKGDKHKRATVIAKGILTRKVSGIVTIDSKLYEFPIDIVIDGGMPYIDGFKPVYSDAVKKKAKKSFNSKKTQDNNKKEDK